MQNYKPIESHLGDVAENSTTLSRQLFQPLAPSHCRHCPCQPKNSSIRSVKSNFLPPGFSPNGGLAQVCQPAKRLAVFVGTAVEAVPLNSDLDIRTTHGQAKSLRAPRLVHCGSRHDGLHLPTLSASSHFFRHDKPIHLPVIAREQPATRERGKVWQVRSLRPWMTSRINDLHLRVKQDANHQ